MAENERKYGITLQVCSHCDARVLIAAPSERFSGAVQLTMCPAVRTDGFSCDGRLFPETSTVAVGAFLVNMAASFEFRPPEPPLTQSEKGLEAVPDATEEGGKR